MRSPLIYFPSNLLKWEWYVLVFMSTYHSKIVLGIKCFVQCKLKLNRRSLNYIRYWKSHKLIINIPYKILCFFKYFFFYFTSVLYFEKLHDFWESMLFKILLCLAFFLTYLFCHQYRLSTKCVSKIQNYNPGISDQFIC